MNPGIYTDLAFADYHALDYASASRLKTLRQSPAHLKAEIDGLTEKSSPALALGRAIHAAVLEPDVFATTYVRAGQCTASTKAGAQCRNDGVCMTLELGWLCGVHLKGAPVTRDERTALSEADYATCLGIRDSIRAHAIASDLLLESEGASELTLIWDDVDTGVRCKARLDRHSQQYTMIGDLKTTQDASPEGFARAIATYEYHIQDVHYLEGARVCGLDADDFVFVAVEKVAPYAVGVYRIDTAMRDLARGQWRYRMQTYAECLASDVWPAYSSEIRLITLPTYSQARVRNESDAALVGV